MPHLFEFMDLSWLPASLRTTLREILDCGNSWPFRDYYRWAATQVQEIVSREGLQRVVELGAGTAPITRHLASQNNFSNSVDLVCCDLNPDKDAYRTLVVHHGNRVQPVMKPFDFTRPCQWPPGTLLVLSATLHHIPSSERSKVLVTLAASAERVLVVEPLRKTIASFLFTFGSLIPSLILPFAATKPTVFLRRLMWCWAIPVAPIAFVWDGMVSVIRQWSHDDWSAELSTSDGELEFEIRESLFCQALEINRTASGAANPAALPAERCEFATSL